MNREMAALSAVETRVGEARRLKTAQGPVGRGGDPKEDPKEDIGAASGTPHAAQH
jgi:hypothetical protein